MKDSQVDRVAHTVALTQTAPRLMRYVAQLTTVAGHVSDHLNHWPTPVCLFVVLRLAVNSFVGDVYLVSKY